MIAAEAEWVKKNSQKYLSPASAPVLELASSTLLFRTQDQPFIEELVIKPIEAITGSKVIHSDIKEGVGVDMPGNIYDPAFQQEIIAKKFNTILCLGLLSSVKDATEAIGIVSKFVPQNGLLFVSAAHRFPAAFDPIENFFRPTPEELFSYFDHRSFVLVEKELLSGPSYAGYLLKNPRLLLNRLVRIFTPFYQFQSWKQQMKYMPKYLKPLQQSCIIIKRVA